MIELIYLLVMTHITIVCVTLYLHRGQTHRGITFHPAVAHFMRFWLWLTTGMVTKQWVAIHRKHHRYVDKQEDPHSPKLFGIKNILFGGVYYYYQAAKDARMIVEYGVGTPNDWIERKVYTKHHFLGVFLLLAINVLLFGLTQEDCMELAKHVVKIVMMAVAQNIWALSGWVNKSRTI